jgi:tRNA uridine 5-carboxymethylaminomethyl modification enzyme
LVLRQDNADERLTPIGYEIGLISEERYQKFLQKQEQKQQEIKRLKNTVISPTEEVNRILVSRETSEITTGVRLIEQMKRPQLDYEVLTPVDTTRPDLPRAVRDGAQIEIKYEGYIAREMAEVEKFRRLEHTLLPKDADYSQIKGIRIEAAQKLQKIRPESIGQASRISGISPADISVLLIWLKMRDPDTSKE